ncbi:hypothetical protein Pcinc_002069 [Petrolisthes cinctipes]|uniref:Uncharacterized protein n=1 Tax=Petrolisthes cinctipes TaxID=88211 RepID=A0AAE1GLR8_PETCI|nr:hypothetical protein Pcinc_002069 [Petrolisthes cinctipes]
MTAVIGNVPVDSHLDMSALNLDPDLREAITKQLRFELDAASDIIKNYIASHNVMHSFAFSALRLFSDRINEKRGAWTDQEEGNFMAVCRVVDTCADVAVLIKEAKTTMANIMDKEIGGDAPVVVGSKYIESTVTGKGGGPTRCNLCGDVGHGSTPILGQFSDRLRKEYTKRNEYAVKEKKRKQMSEGMCDMFVVRSAAKGGECFAADTTASTRAVQQNIHGLNEDTSSIENARRRIPSGAGRAISELVFGGEQQETAADKREGVLHRYESGGGEEETLTLYPADAVKETRGRQLLAYDQVCPVLSPLLESPERRAPTRTPTYDRVRPVLSLLPESPERRSPTRTPAYDRVRPVLLPPPESPERRAPTWTPTYDRVRPVLSPLPESPDRHLTSPATQRRRVLASKAKRQQPPASKARRQQPPLSKASRQQPAPKQPPTEKMTPGPSVPRPPRRHYAALVLPSITTQGEGDPPSTPVFKVVPKQQQSSATMTPRDLVFRNLQERLWPPSSIPVDGSEDDDYTTSSREEPSDSSFFVSRIAPTLANTDRITSNVRQLESHSFSPSAPAVTDRDRANRTAINKTLREYVPRRK